MEEPTKPAAAERQLPPNALTTERVVSKVADVKYALLPDGVTTLCVLTTLNGTVLVGKSVCLDPAQLNQEISEKVAFEDAVNALWPLENYLLQEELRLNAMQKNPGAQQ